MWLKQMKLQIEMWWKQMKLQIEVYLKQIKLQIEVYLKQIKLQIELSWQIKIVEHGIWWAFISIVNNKINVLCICVDYSK